MMGVVGVRGVAGEGGCISRRLLSLYLLLRRSCLIFSARLWLGVVVGGVGAVWVGVAVRFALAFVVVGVVAVVLVVVGGVGVIGGVVVCVMGGNCASSCRSSSVGSVRVMG